VKTREKFNTVFWLKPFVACL